MSLSTGIALNKYPASRASDTTDSDVIEAILVNTYGFSEVWTLDDASGTDAVAYVNSARDGTYSGVVLQDRAGPGSLSDRSFAGFDGVNDYVDKYSSNYEANLSVSEFTLLMLLYCESGGLRQRFYITLSMGNTYILLDTVNNTDLEVRAVFGGTNKVVTVPLTLNAWILVTLTISQTDDEMKVYINNAQVGTTQTGLGTANFSSLDNGRVVIGANNLTGGLPFKGNIGIVSERWDGTLTAAQISDIYDEIFNV